MVQPKDSEGIVFDCIRKNPNRKTEELKEILVSTLSNDPINSALKSLKEKNLIRNDSRNRRENRWVAVQDNPVAKAISQQDDFESAFKALLGKIIESAESVESSFPEEPDISEIEKSALILDSIHLYIEFTKLQGFLSLFVWSRDIDPETLGQLFARMAVKQIQWQKMILSALQDYGYQSDDLSKFIPNAPSSGNLTLLSWSYEKFRKRGLGTEVRPILDILWNMSVSLSPSILGDYQRLYESKSTDWREFMKLEKKRIDAISEKSSSDGA